MNRAGAATATVLVGLGALHVAWGLGSAFPVGDRTDLADAVAGTDRFPGRTESFAVAGLLGAAATVVAGPSLVPRRLTALGRLGVAAVLGTRGVLGLTNRTGQVVGWTTSPRFDRLDRRYYGPLCLALATGALATRR
ncbi:MAG TPA: DUF3995 domain-containing protein [Ilumatobacter sp.]|nr:DUF3995 domain-containing protein [Ilumatobacter sp.]